MFNAVELNSQERSQTVNVNGKNITVSYWEREEKYEFTIGLELLLDEAAQEYVEAAQEKLVNLGLVDQGLMQAPNRLHVTILLEAVEIEKAIDVASVMDGVINNILNDYETIEFTFTGEFGVFGRDFYNKFPVLHIDSPQLNDIENLVYESFHSDADPAITKNLSRFSNTYNPHVTLTCVGTKINEDTIPKKLSMGQGTFEQNVSETIRFAHITSEKEIVPLEADDLRGRGDSVDLLRDYIATRKGEAENTDTNLYSNGKSYSSFWGRWFGFSAERKIDAAEKLIQILEGGENTLTPRDESVKFSV